MKNYKAEVRKILDKYIKAYDDVASREVDKIAVDLSLLFREIAKEAVGKIKKEQKHDGHSTDEGLWCYSCGEYIKEGTCTSATHDNRIRSEILSNIEKVIK